MNVEHVLRQCSELWKTDRYNDAVKLLTDALRDTTNARLFYSRAATFDLMDEPGKAVDDLTSAISLDGTNPKYLFDRGCILAFPLDKHDEAIHDFEQVLKCDPDHVEAHRQCCGSLLIMGRPNRALEHAVAALRLAPDEARTHFYVGEAYIALGRFEEAVVSLKTAVQLDSTKDQYSSSLKRAIEKLDASSGGWGDKSGRDFRPL